jgi:Flp pilus assembly protein TadD
MTWLKKLFAPDTDEEVDYYQEGLDLLRAAKHHEALTSFRLALRKSPNDLAAMLQMAITYTRIGMTGEARKTYGLVLASDPSASAAHYGLAFLLLRDGEDARAVEHLRAFLAAPPTEPEALRHVAHARETLARLTGQSQEGSDS